jgi:hypothetical protein
LLGKVDRFVGQASSSGMLESLPAAVNRFPMADHRRFQEPKGISEILPFSMSDLCPNRN